MISTGAGIALSFFPLARARGLDCHFIESAARSRSPSLTGKVLRRLPGMSLYTQYPEWASGPWRYAGSVFDGFSAAERPPAPDPSCGGHARHDEVPLPAARRPSLQRFCLADVEVLWQTGATGVADLPLDRQAAASGARAERRPFRAADVVIAHAGAGLGADRARGRAASDSRAAARALRRARGRPPAGRRGPPREARPGAVALRGGAGGRGPRAGGRAGGLAGPATALPPAGTERQMSGEVPRVAVLLPAYNGEDLLQQALESVVAQTYADWEAVVVDDASSDRTAEVAQSFARRAPERVTVIRLSENLGVGGAREAAIRATRGGELICLLDQDDYWDERYLERSVAEYDSALAAGRRVGIVTSNALTLTGEGITGETWWDRNGWVEPLDLDAMIRHNYVMARSPLLPSRIRGRRRGVRAELRRLRRLRPVAADPRGGLRGHRRPGAPRGLPRPRRQLLPQSPGHGRGQDRRLPASARPGRADAPAPACGEGTHAPLRCASAPGSLPARGSRAAAGASFGHGVWAAPYGLVAFAQDPRRWGEWGRDLVRSAGRLGRSRHVAA